MKMYRIIAGIFKDGQNTFEAELNDAARNHWTVHTVDLVTQKALMEREVDIDSN
jgi:hypothetical protein